jgi:hypothetical protein
VQVALPQQAAVRVDRQQAGADELARAAALAEPQPVEAHQHRAGEAVVEARDVDVGGRDPGAAEQLDAQEVGEVAGVVLGEHVVADVQAGPRARPVGGRGHPDRGTAQVTGPFQRGHEQRAGPVHLRRAVRGPEGVDDER